MHEREPTYTTCLSQVLRSNSSCSELRLYLAITSMNKGSVLLLRFQSSRDGSTGRPETPTGQRRSISIDALALASGVAFIAAARARDSAADGSFSFRLPAANSASA